MYNYGYKQPLMSKETLMELALNNNVCSGCTSCSVKCPSGFKVADKIAAINPIVDVPYAYLT
jgi:ferredoxin